MVTRAAGGLSTVRVGEASVECATRGKIRLKGGRTTSPVVVGDRVVVDFDPETRQGAIASVLPRGNYVIRRSTNLSKESQILAANIDQAFVVVTVARPATPLMFVDRMLVSLEAYRIPAVVLFNKVDLYSGDERALLAFYADTYRRAGYRCMECSAATGQGVGAVRDMLAGRVSIFAGQSGVGKSSLANAIDPSLGQRVGEISRSHLQGRHTTTFAAMLPAAGGYIVDTPGVRAFGLVDIDKEELCHFFPEIFRHAAGCRFHNCSHTHEPGCEVLAAVERGDIPPSRYENYVNIYLDTDDVKYRFDDYS